MDRFAAAMGRAMRQSFGGTGSVALYYADPAAANPTFILVKITDRFMAGGDLKGTSMQSAEMESESPLIEFLNEQGVRPVRNAYVAVQPGIVYQIDTVLPPEQFSTVARALRMRTPQCKGFPVPSPEAITQISRKPSLARTPQPTWIVEEW